MTTVHRLLVSAIAYSPGTNSRKKRDAMTLHHRVCQELLENQKSKHVLSLYCRKAMSRTHNVKDDPTGFGPGHRYVDMWEADTLKAAARCLPNLEMINVEISHDWVRMFIDAHVWNRGVTLDAWPH